MRPTRIVIFAKAPVPGTVKTRLILAVGESGAAGLAQRMLLGTVAEAVAAGLSTPELCASPGPDDPVWRPLLPAAQSGLPTRATGTLASALPGLPNE
jgi:hypothetical protein